MPTNDELLIQLAQKLDQLIHELPERYVDERRHVALEKRVDTLEIHATKIDDTISNLHNNSMAFVTSEFQKMEHRILDKIEANAKTSSSNWLIISVAIVSSLIGIGSMLVAIFK
jgi:CHASE3 domain sensor protein